MSDEIDWSKYPNALRWAADPLMRERPWRGAIQGLILYALALSPTTDQDGRGMSLTREELRDQAGASHEQIDKALSRLVEVGVLVPAGTDTWNLGVAAPAGQTTVWPWESRPDQEDEDL